MDVRFNVRMLILSVQGIDYGRLKMTTNPHTFSLRDSFFLPLNVVWPMVALTMESHRRDAELILYIGLVLDFKRTDAYAMVSYKSDHYPRNLTRVEICQTTWRGSDKGPGGGVGDGNQPTPSSSKRAIPVTLDNSADKMKK